MNLTFDNNCTSSSFLPLFLFLLKTLNLLLREADDVIDADADAMVRGIRFRVW